MLVVDAISAQYTFNNYTNKRAQITNFIYYVFEITGGFVNIITLIAHIIHMTNDLHIINVDKSR